MKHLLGILPLLCFMAPSDGGGAANLPADPTTEPAPPASEPAADLSAAQPAEHPADKSGPPDAPKAAAKQKARGQERTALAKALHAGLLSNPEFAHGRKLDDPKVAVEAANIAVTHANALLAELADPEAQ